MNDNPLTGNDLGLTDKNESAGCACCAHDSAAAPAGAAASEEYLVSGMTCGHCVASVTEEISAIEGVESVNVDLNVGGTSRVTVVSSVPIAEHAVRAAVNEAGYELVATPA